MANLGKAAMERIRGLDAAAVNAVESKKATIKEGANKALHELVNTHDDYVKLAEKAHEAVVAKREEMRKEQEQFKEGITEARKAVNSTSSAVLKHLLTK